MTKRAELADGRVLEFPDDTPMEVIRRVVKEQIAASKVPTAAPTAAAPVAAPVAAPTQTQYQKQAIAQRTAERGIFGQAYDAVMGNEIEAPEAYTAKELAARQKQLAATQKKLVAAAAEFDKLATRTAKEYQNPNAPDRAANFAQRAQTAREEAAALGREFETITKTGLKAPKASKFRETLSATLRTPAEIIAGIPGAIEATAGYGLGTFGLPGAETLKAAGKSDMARASELAAQGFGAQGEALKYDATAKFLADVGGGVGSVGTFLGPGLLSKAAGAGKGLVGAARAEAIANAARPLEYGLGTVQGAQQGIQDIQATEQRTGEVIPDANAFAAILLNAGLGATEVGVARRIFESVPVAKRGAALDAVTDIVRRGTAGRIDPAVISKSVSRVLNAIESRAAGRIAVRGGEEALQEGGVQLGTNVIAKGLYDEDRDITEGVGYSALIGGIVGSGLRGVTEVTQKAMGKAKKQGVDPAAVMAEFQRVAAEQVGRVMKANPGMKQNDAVKFVEDNAEALFNLANANIVSGTKGVLDVPVTTGAGMDVGGGSGAGTAIDRESLATETGTTVAGENVDGRLGKSVSSVSVPTTGETVGERPLIEPTAKQVKAMVPTIEQAFEASAVDFEDAYADVLDKNNKLNAQQKTLAARILVQSPEVDPYDAIGSVLDRGLETLTGKPVPKKVPSTSRTVTTINGKTYVQEGPNTLTDEEAQVERQKNDDTLAGLEDRLKNAPGLTVPLDPFAAPSVDEVAVAPIKAAIKSVTAPTGSGVPTLAQTSARQAGIAPAPVEAAAPVETVQEPVQAEVAAPAFQEPSYNPADFTPQEVYDNLTYFGYREAERRGYVSNTAENGMFGEGVREAKNPDIKPLTDEQVLSMGRGNPEVLAAYKEGQQFGKDTVAATQAVPASNAAPTTAGAKPSTARGPSKVKAAGTKGAKAKAVKKVISSKPGKTVAEKIFNMAQAEVDAMPKEDLAEQVTPYDPEFETIRAKPGINAARMAKMLGPQLYGDPTNMGQVCIKEVLQNSFDATRTAVDNGQIEQGKIEISVSADGRTLTVKDNGIGMTPELLGGKFLEIAGTDKEGDKNAGGFGIAKMLFLYANKNIRVSTARDGRVAVMDVTGEQLFEGLDNPDARPLIDIRDLEPADQLAFPDGHGTIIQLTIPEESGDYKIKTLPDYLDYIPSLNLSPLFSNIEVTFNPEGYTWKAPEPAQIGSNFPIQDYTQFVGVKFAWGTAKVYVTRDQTGQKYGENMHVLSNGLWQFSTMVKKDPASMYGDPVPYRFYVDIVPSVKPDQPGYPFNFNRQNFTDDAQRDFGKIKKYIDAIYAYKSRAGEATSFGSIQYFDENGQLGPVIDLTPDIKVQDTAFTRIAEGDQITVDENGALLVNGNAMPELTPDQLKAGIPSASDLTVNPDLIDTNSVMVHDNADVVVKSTGEKMPIPDFMRRQFGERFDSFMLLNGQTFLKLRDEVARVMGYSSLYNEAIGVSFDPEYRGVSIRLPFSGSFINPLVPQYADGFRAGYGIFGTMIHELAHHKVRSHNASFPSEMQNILLNMEADLGFPYQQFKDNFADTIAADYADIVKLGVELFNGQNSDISIEYRGNKFTDGSGEQASEGTGDSGTGDVRGHSREGSTGESLLGPTYERRGRTGERGDLGASDEGGTEPLTDANVEEAVSVKLTKAQIKRLEAAAGIRGMEVNKLQKRIIQSRNDNEIKGLVKRLSEAVQNPDANSGIIASLTQSMPPIVYKTVLGFQQIDDVFRLAKLAGLKAIGKIDTIMREEYIPYVNRIVRRASKVEQEWTAFASRNPEGNRALDDSMIYSNMIDADPSLAVTAAEYMRIDPKLKELEASLATEADANKRKGLKGQITRRKDDIKRLYFGGELKDADGNPILDEDKNPVVVLGWNSLPPEGRKIFKAARDFHRANFNEHYRLLMQRIDDAKFDSNDAVKLKSSIEEMFNKARERTIYFPVKRFGDYWLSVGNDFYMRETPAELKALQRRLKKEGETRAMVLGTSREDLRNKVASNDASAALKGILDALDGSNTTKNNGKPRLEKDDIEGLRDLVFQMYLTALPEADMRRRFVHRRFITGFSTDSLRTFAATAVASANQLGRLAYNYKFQNVLEEAKAASESDELTPYRDALRSEIAERVKSVLAPEANNSIVNAINKVIAFGSKVTFYHHLSSAASAMVNLTQLHSLGLPVLSGEFGEAKTAAMAARYTTSFLAGREIPNPFRDEDGNVALQAPDFKLQNSAYMRGLKKSNPDRYKQTLAALEYAQDNDIIESTFASSAQLYERSNTPTGKFNFRQAVRRGDALTAAQRASANAMSAMGFLFHSTETIGRGIMYMSSFDLAYERAIGQGKTPEQAGMEGRKLAAELTNKAMFDFTNWNKSRFAKAPAGRLALQMTSYIHSLSSLLLRSFVGMMPYFNKEGKAAAARVFFGSAGVTALYGGIRSTQFYALTMGAYALVKFVEDFFDDDDEEKQKDTKEGVLGKKTVEREFLKYADENGNELGKKDMEYYIRATWIDDTFGKGSTLQKAFGLSDKAAANLATAADMGIPGVFGVDISGSVAMGDLPFIWSNVQVKGDTPEVRAYEAAARMALGPAGSVGVSYVKAADAWNKGDVDQAIEAVVPAAIRNPLKALRLNEEGLLIGKDKDIQLKDPSYYTNGKTVLQSLGFKDAETSRNMQLDMLAGDVEREVAEQKTELLDRRYRAILKYDADPSPKNKLELQQVEYDINVYDENYPSNSMSNDTKRKSFKGKEQDAADKSYGLGVNPKIPIRDVLYEERIQQALEDEGK